MSNSEGRCYELAWQFIFLQQEGELVHGSVANGPKVDRLADE